MVHISVKTMMIDYKAMTKKWEGLYIEVRNYFDLKLRCIMLVPVQSIIVITFSLL